MTWKSFFDNPEEIFIGAVLQFPLYFIVKWWIAPIMVLCGFLWRLGGWRYGNKLFRRLGVPIVVCLSAFLAGVHWPVFLAIPYMIWFAPSYGVESWLYKLLKVDFPVRLITYFWYWTVFLLAFLVAKY
jgi:hypothetical protein